MSARFLDDENENEDEEDLSFEKSLFHPAFAACFGAAGRG